MSGRDESLPPGAADPAMLQLLAQMSELLGALQEEIDREDDLFARMKADREAWEGPAIAVPEAATSIDTYQDHVYHRHIRLAVAPGFGRIFEATEAIAAGEIILVEDVFVEARDADWRDHEEVLERFLGMWSLAQATTALGASQTLLLDDLANAHEDTLDALTGWVEEVEDTGLRPSLPAREFAWRLGVGLTNAFAYQDGAGGTWRGLFPLAGMMSHSCRPNAMYTIENGRLFFQTIHPIEAGQELTHSYVNTSLPAAQKRTILQETFGFVCQCPSCRSTH